MNPRDPAWLPSPALLAWLYALDAYNNQTIGKPKAGKLIEMPRN